MMSWLTRHCQSDSVWSIIEWQICVFSIDAQNITLHQQGEAQEISNAKHFQPACFDAFNNFYLCVCVYFSVPLLAFPEEECSSGLNLGVRIHPNVSVVQSDSIKPSLQFLNFGCCTSKGSPIQIF